MEIFLMARSSASRAKQRRPCSSEGELLAETLADGRIRIVRPEMLPARSVAWRISHFWFRYPRLRESWSEICSCYQRIRLVCKQGAIGPPDTGRYYLRAADGGLVENTTSQGRFRDIEMELRHHPRVSPWGMQMFLCGWEAGRAHGVRTFGSPSEESIPDK